jgi:hypothetical protein
MLLYHREVMYYREIEKPGAHPAAHTFTVVCTQKEKFQNRNGTFMGWRS